MSEESEDRVPSKEEFDKLFFSKRHVLLEAVVRTVCALFNTFSDNNNATQLVTQQRQNRSVEYATIISDYFRVHDKYLELIQWAIDIDFISTDTLLIDASSFQNSTFFIPFYNEFVNYTFKNYMLSPFSARSIMIGSNISNMQFLNV